MIRQVESIVVGGGQAGLAASYCLQQRQHEHIVLEQTAQVANAWRNDRWDSFTFVTPNWTIKIRARSMMAANRIVTWSARRSSAILKTT